MHAIHGFDDEENHPSDDEELDDVLNEVAVSDDGFGVSAEEIRNADGELSEVGAAHEKADDGHNDVVDEGIDDGGEGATDGNTDGEVNYGAAIDEFHEFFAEAAGFFAGFFEGVFGGGESLGAGLFGFGTGFSGLFVCVFDFVAGFSGF